MKNKQFFILILLLVIGFASISATLVINGNTKIAANLDDFNVIFIEGFLNGETNEDVIISGDKKTLAFTTNKLTNINDIARIDYKVKNISTQYDGDVTINCTNESNEYVNVTSSFDGHNLPLTNSINMQAQEVKSGYINAELTKPTTEEQEIKITCKIEVLATSRTNYAYSLVFDSDGGSAIEDKSVNLNDSYGELSVPTKEGYTFIGWFNEDDVMIGSDTVFDSQGNRNLHAKWSKNAYPVEIRKTYSDRTETSEINIPYGEYIDTLITVGDEYYISNIECTNGYTIDNFNKDNIIYNEQTIRINNNNITKESTCTISINKGIFTYSYTGNEQEFIVPLDGNYKIELWGASGALEQHKNTIKSGGAYTSGEITLIKNSKFYVYVGEKAKVIDRNNTDYSTLTFANTQNGFNGGGKGNRQCGDGSQYGGIMVSAGATDIRTINGNWNNIESLRSRIMVAAASGGTTYSTDGSDSVGGPGGGLTGYNGTRQSYGTGATQVSGGSVNGSFGSGGNANWTAQACNVDEAAGGSGGWYGGGGATARGSYTYSSGGSGSSYISGHSGCIAVTSRNDTTPKCSNGSTSVDCSKSWTNYIFINTVMIDGAGYKWTTTKGEYAGMPSYDGKATMTGNTDNGYAKITYLGK